MIPSAPFLSPAAPLRGGSRLLRISVLGAVSLMLAAGAHTAGGGSLPGSGVLLVLAGLVGLMALVVTQRRCRFPVLVAVLGAQQAALHAVLTAASGPAAVCTGLNHHGSLAAGGCTPVADAAAAAPMMMSGPSMWLAHGIAVLATAWLLSRGEAWLWRTADRVIQTATASPSSLWRPFPSVRIRAAVLAMYASTVASPAAPRGPPRCWTV